MTGDVVRLKSGGWYVQVNNSGTLEKIARPKWYRVLLFYVISVFKRPRTVQQTKRILGV